jgi:hypothetical protein
MNPGDQIQSASTGATYTLNKREKERTKSTMKVMCWFTCDNPSVPGFCMTENDVLLMIDRGVFKEV